MKRIWILLVVVALGVALAAPASAAKPNCELDPGHPSCKPADEDPPADGPVGMTCVEADAALRNIAHVEPTWTGDNSFRLELNNKERACVDVMSAEGVWTIDVVTLGSASAVGLAIGDSVNPGDTCWGGCHGDVEADVSAENCDGGIDGRRARW